MTITRIVRRTCLAVATVVLAASACSDDRAIEVPDPTAPTIVADPSTSGDVPPQSTTTGPGDAPADLDVPLTLTRVVGLDAPTAFAAWPGTTKALVAERQGRIMIIDLAATPAVVVGEALDVSARVGDISGEQGLLGIAIDSSAGTLVVSLTEKASDGGSVIESYTLGDDGVDASSRREILRLDQPFANHNGGHVAFGPEGSLYIGFGDGGSQGDPGDNGQNPSTLLASILRIDLNPADAPLPYSVRDDNPFADGDGGRQEVFLYGVRNPWRFSFDRATGDLWVGDVGGSSWEEIDVLWASEGGGAGANLGWSLREGRHDTAKAGTLSGTPVEPIAEYDHDRGSSVTGGFVYRGSAIPRLVGAYVYADYAVPGLRGVVAEDGATEASREADLSIDGAEVGSIVSFGEGTDGELYVLSLDGGVYRIDPAV